MKMTAADTVQNTFYTFILCIETNDKREKMVFDLNTEQANLSKSTGR